MASKFEGKQIDCRIDIDALTYCCIIIPLYHCIIIPLSHCIIVPLYHCTIVPLYYCKTKVKLAPFRQYSYKVNATNK